MLPADKYRAAAKREAWYDDDHPDALPNYNPFRKIRTKTKDRSDVENPAVRTQTNYSENCAPNSIEDERRSRNFDDVSVPKHADTMPSSSSKSPVNGFMSNANDFEQSPHPVEHEREKEDSQDSGAVSSETVVDSEPSTVPKTRHRKFPFIGKKSKVGGDEELEKPRRRSSLFRADTQKFTAVGQLRATLLNSYINVLLIFVPIGIAVNYVPGVSRVGVFVINFIAIIPLAAMLSYATEEIALRVGETLGGLLNATFG
jgi:Ca2+:H+ antiporter